MPKFRQLAAANLVASRMAIGQPKPLHPPRKESTAQGFHDAFNEFTEALASDDAEPMCSEWFQQL